MAEYPGYEIFNVLTGYFKSLYVVKKLIGVCLNNIIVAFPFRHSRSLKNIYHSMNAIAKFVSAIRLARPWKKSPVILPVSCKNVCRDKLRLVAGSDEDSGHDRDHDELSILPEQ